MKPEACEECGAVKHTLLHVDLENAATKEVLKTQKLCGGCLVVRIQAGEATRVEVL